MALVVICWMRGLQEGLLSLITPRYLECGTSLIGDESMNNCWLRDTFYL